MSDPDPQPTVNDANDSSVPDPEPLAIDSDDLSDLVDRYEDQESEKTKDDDRPDIRSDVQP